MLCSDSENNSPLTAAHTTPLGTLIISSPHVSCAWLRCWPAQLQLAGQTCNAHHTCTVPDPCNAELPICTRLCIICMAPGQDRNSASPATLQLARHPPQATSLFLATVAPEAVLAHLKHVARVQPVAFPRRFVFVSDNLPNVLKTSISR